MKRLGLILLLSLGVRADIFTTHFTDLGRWSESDGAFFGYSGNVPTEGLYVPIMGPDGKIYAAGNGVGYGAVFRFDGQTGQVIGTFVDYIMDSSKPLSMGPPTGMTFATNGNLLVANTPVSGATAGLGRVFEYDGTTGAFVRKFVAERTGRWLALGSISLGPDGNVYLLDRNVGVTKLDGDGFPLGVFIQTTNLINGFFGPDGNYYACSRSTGDLLRFNGTTGASMGNLVTASDASVGDISFATFGPNGDIYAKCGTTNVYRFDGTNGVMKGKLFSIVPPTNPNIFEGFIFSGLRVTINGFPTIKVKFPETRGAFVLERSSSLEVGTSWFPTDSDFPLDALWREYVPNPTIEQVYFRLRTEVRARCVQKKSALHTLRAELLEQIHFQMARSIWGLGGNCACHVNR